MITKRYNDFIFEQFISAINESEIVYSKKFRKLLKDIDSPVAKYLGEIEFKDYNVTNNYFDVSDSKDMISFISDKKFQEILSSNNLLAKYNGRGGILSHNIAQNENTFNRLGYKPETPNPYHPDEEEIGKVISRVFSSNGNVYVYMKFPLGECVVNENKLTYEGGNLLDNKEQKVRVGRGIRTILNATDKKFTDSQIEDFVNKYKSAFDRMNDIFSNFELVSGDKIAHWYNKDTYLYGLVRGTLGNSCMAASPSDYFQIYTKNPKVISLLILKDEVDSNLIKGRALVWKLKKPENVIFMDRIYTHNDSDVQLFIDYSKFMKWYYKSKNNSGPNEAIIGPDGEYLDQPYLEVFIKPGRYSKYPYVDTLKYYNTDTGELSNREDDDEICLEDTSGGFINNSCELCGGCGRIECGECGGRGNIECPECAGKGRVGCKNCDMYGKVKCPKCEGAGTIDIDGEGTVECEECDGEGAVECPECDGEGAVECEECDGSGSIKCPECDGEGEINCPECQ